MPPRKAKTAQEKAEEAAYLACVDEAITAVVASGTTPTGRPIFSLRAAAKQYDVATSTLTARYNGRTTRVGSHVEQQKLSPSQEAVLKEWIKVMGVRGVPLTMTAVAEYASAIVGEVVTENWARKFRRRHPDLKARWTTTLESCRAGCLNRPLVAEYFNVLEDLLHEYDIPPENIYNMDEKGIQLGIGQRCLVLVDRDQRTVYHVEDGNRELVTIIETTCADGSALRPSVIFKGKTRDLEWGRFNPCNASISFSPKGWIDNELGTIWLKQDFDPETAARNLSNGWRLLILDGHNSHCTYSFCSYAEAHKIIILCLVAHTTHRCQPNDVGVFGPLAASWKSQVTQLSRQFKKITKYNLLQYYHAAREKVLTKSTIQAAFRTTGIWPFNRDIIEDAAFEPAKNTTTQSAQPVAARLPALLQLIPDATDTVAAPAASSDAPPSVPTTPAAAPTAPTTPAAGSARYSLAGLPPTLPPSASRSALLENNRQLLEYTARCTAQMTADYASKKLMDAENGRLREVLFAKKNKPAKQRVGGAGARHMTSGETLGALAYIDWKANMATMHAEFRQNERAIAAKQACDRVWQEMMDEGVRLVKEAAAAKKAVERGERHAVVEAERALKKAEADAERATKKAVALEAAAEKKRLLDEERARKKEAVEAERARKKEAMELEKQRKADAKETKRKEKAAAAPKRGTKRKRTDDTDLDNDENQHPPIIPYTPDTPPAEKRPRPMPKPTYRSSAAVASTQDSGLGLPTFGTVLTNVQWAIDPALE